MSVLRFIHVAHFADLLVAKVQCRGAWEVAELSESESGVTSRGYRFPGRTLWIPVAGFEPGTSTSEASEVLDRCSLPHDRSTVENARIIG